MNRRRFLQRAAAASAASLLGLRSTKAAGRTGAPRTILVLGGTSFLGPAIVEAAVAAGHGVTLFNRGITNPELFPRVEKLRGFRSPAASEERWQSVGSRRWDAVVDVWPSDPVLAASAANRLRGQSGHYLYVSSIGAYQRRDFQTVGLTEDAPLNAWDPEIRPYDRGKAESERRVRGLVGERLTIVRPGPIKGERDDSPDLYAWLRRARSGGRRIGPGSGEDHVQLVDVKDVARFLVLAIDRSLYGDFNLTGEPVSFRQFLERCNRATRSDTEFVWIPREFLHEQGLDPVSFDSPNIPSYLGNFPFWHPEPGRVGFFQISSRKAFDAGWSQRSFDETAGDCLWTFASFGPEFSFKDELDPAAEAQALERWSRRG
jgi:2'-hydroxyisoflavone reductase